MVNIVKIQLRCIHVIHTMRQEDVDTAEVALLSPGYTQESQQDLKMDVGQAAGAYRMNCRNVLGKVGQYVAII